MKKNIKILCTAAVMGCLTAFPSWAAETKAEYKEEIGPGGVKSPGIRNETYTRRKQGFCCPL